MQRMIENVLEQAPDAILVANGDGVIRYANRRIEHVIGYAPQELIGQNLRILIHPELWETHDRHLERLKNSSPAAIFGLRREVFAVHRDGRELIVELHVSPLVGESEPLYIATLSDIMARKLNEFHREVLADQLATQNKKLQQILDSTAATNRIHRELLGYLDQELRAALDQLTACHHVGSDDARCVDGAKGCYDVRAALRLTERKLRAVLERMDHVRIETGQPSATTPAEVESPSSRADNSENRAEPSGWENWSDRAGPLGIGAPLRPTRDGQGATSLAGALPERDPG
jgi:PAS domain S-box-containing protein